MSRILISGYYGFNNAGDDTVLYGIISSLKKHDAALEIAVLSNTPAETTKLFGIPAFNRWRLKEIVRELKESDLLLMGGGSLLQDATSPRSVMYYLGIVMIAKMLKKPVVFFAQGVGPISRRLSKRLIKMIVNKVDVITVRDHQSGEDLKSYGVSKAPIHVTADPALTIHPGQISLTSGRDILQALNVDFHKPSAAISVRDWKNETMFKKEIAQMADEFIRMGWNVVFLPMHYPSDVSSSHDILNLMEQKKAAIILETKINFKEIISVIGNMDFVLGMRLHSVILASVMNIPFAGISYDPKLDRFVERIGMTPAGHIQDLHYDDLKEIVHQITNDLEENKKKLQEHMGEMVKTAKKSSLLALETLEKHRIE